MFGTAKHQKNKIKARSRFRVVTVHVFKSAVLFPLPVKYLLFVVLALSDPPLPVALLLWGAGCIAVHVLAIHKSLSSIRRKVTMANPERCVVPSMIAFGILGFFSLLVDAALAANSGSNPGSLILLSVGLNFVVFVYQSLLTHQGFTTMPGANRELPISKVDILVGAGDVAFIAAYLIVVILAMTASF